MDLAIKNISKYKYIVHAETHVKIPDKTKNFSIVIFAKDQMANSKIAIWRYRKSFPHLFEMSARGLTSTVDMIFMGETKSYKCVEPREMLGIRNR